MNTLRKITALNAVTATTVSQKFWVGGAKRIGVLLRRAAHSAGSTAFSIKGSVEDYQQASNSSKDEHNNKHGGAGVTMTALNMFIDNVTNSNAQNLTRVNGKTLSADGDAFLWLDPNVFVNWLEITATETTDGTHSAYIFLEE